MTCAGVMGIRESAVTARSPAEQDLLAAAVRRLHGGTFGVRNEAREQTLNKLGTLLVLEAAGGAVKRQFQ